MKRSAELLSLLLFLFVCLCLPPVLLGQTETGSIAGQVRDPQGAAVPGADVKITNTATGVTVAAKTNGTGNYYFPSLRPSNYKISVTAAGFKESVLNVEVHVQDRLSENISLALGASSETVNVNASAQEVDTSSSVSTEVSRSFIENMPLNGRSFQALIDLTPGSVTAKSYYSGIGQFSVDGQRTDANYFSIDGVSANVGITQGSNVYLGAAGAGAAQATSNNGGYNNMVSVDALQEYKIQTSTFAPEYGRTPGAQLSIVTKSGTNNLHGSLFEYLRNDVFDSRDYFARVNHLAKPAEKQNDFGGTLGGPIIKNKLFFFFSYEGLRLRVPFTRTEIVPSTYARQNAIAAVQPLFNAYPLPTKNDVPGVYTADAIMTFSNPSTLNATSLRLDYNVTPKLTVFLRGDDGPSNGSQHGAFDFYSRSTLSTTISNVATITGGATYVFNNRLVNDLRVNLSQAKGATVVTPTDFAGAVAPSDAYLFSTNPNYNIKNSVFSLYMFDGSTGWYVGNDATNHQRQFNIVDSVSFSKANHNMKFGVDYRRLSPTNGYRPWDIGYVATSFADLAQGNIYYASIDGYDTSELRPIFTNLSFYAQDDWRATSRLTFTYGLRWDYDPPPSENSGHPFYTVLNLNDPANVQVAPKGTPLWQPNKKNFAPRLGVAYTVRNTAGRELVLRGGWGLFYGLGNQQGAQGTLGFPYGRTKYLYGVSSGFGTYTFPISPADGTAPPFTDTPVSAFMFAFDPHLKDPRVYQWNVTAEQSLGSSRSLTVSYVGNKSNDLLRREMLTPDMGGNAAFSYLDVVTNDGWSNYNALQTQFRQRPWQGLQVIASYTWSHAIDNGSSVNLPNPYYTVYSPNLDRGNSDFDMRHNFSAAVSYDIPTAQRSALLKGLTSGWAIDSLFRANSSVPVNVTTGVLPAFGLWWNADAGNQRPNIVPGQPFYLHGSQYPGGKIFNAAAFSTPSDSFTQGDLPRNKLRGFGAWQEDMAVRRTFKLTERLNLLFRAEAFNLFNHSNFGDPGAQSDGTNHLNSPNFGYSTQVLSNSLGTGGADGGFSSLYQIGAPRSLQFALKLQF
ncbi:MAG: carboxypeptidase regulatory-like domain-containing protein [Terriglobia bacterium]|nr:carboxypeptidase regulatory-like domain-containing protein [Terriglobia bacterium]